MAAPDPLEVYLQQKAGAVTCRVGVGEKGRRDPQPSTLFVDPNIYHVPPSVSLDIEGRPHPTWIRLEVDEARELARGLIAAADYLEATPSPYTNTNTRNGGDG